MHINLHIRFQELIERDFPHFPRICYLMHNFNPKFAAFPKLIAAPFPQIRIVPEHGEH